MKQWICAICLIWAGVASAEEFAPSAVAVPEQMAASHVLYSYEGAMRAPDGVTRSKAEAQKAGAAALARLRAGAKFEDVARADSDCPSGKKGGSLGTFATNVMHQKFREAAALLKEGALSELVETPFGFHIIRRNRIEVTEVRASHILFMFVGGERAPEGVTRTKDEARQAAVAALAKLKAGAEFADLARAQSDCPSKGQGGDLGTFGKGMMTPKFQEAAFTLNVGELSEVVETPFGFHLIKRTK